MGAVARFLVGAAKAGLGLAFALLLLGGAIWGFAELRDRRTHKANATLANPKSWPDQTIGFLPEAKFRLKTVWRDSRVHYQFEIDGYPSNIARANKSDSSVALKFADKDGFELFSQRVELSSMTRRVGSDGTPTGMGWKGSEFLDSDVYRRADVWEITTSGIPVAPPPEPPAFISTPAPKPQRTVPPVPPVSPPLWKSPLAWATLTHGMTTGAVRALLGEPDKTEVTESGSTWYYGLQPGRQVFFGKTGLVVSWTDY